MPRANFNVGDSGIAINITPTDRNGNPITIPTGATNIEIICLGVVHHARVVLTATSQNSGAYAQSQTLAGTEFTLSDTYLAQLIWTTLSGNKMSGVSPLPQIIVGDRQ